ncbi:MAG TPA: XRE family transcriptional regulator [Candidatus Omnitrophota bacterium]|nr:XRE family transcriptional regulator [Candidatus Omnitrophota bacterium]
MPKTENPSIGRLLRELRKKTGLTQKSAAEKSGISPKTLAAMETGRIQNPTLLNLRNLAETFGLSLQNLFGLFEAGQKNHFFIGSQAGEFSADYPKQKIRVISYLDRSAPLFVGKIILGSKGVLNGKTVSLPKQVFVQIMLGKLNFSLEEKEFFLKEGQIVYFDGRLNYQFTNPLLREATALMITAPSFLNPNA